MPKLFTQALVSGFNFTLACEQVWGEGPWKLEPVSGVEQKLLVMSFCFIQNCSPLLHHSL